MAKFTGNNGSISMASGATSNWGAGVVTANVFNWSLNYSAKNIDVTGYNSSGWEENLPGLKSGVGTFNMYADDTQALNLATSNSGTVPVVELRLFSTTRKFSGTANITGMVVNSDGKSDEAPTVTYSFKYTGSFTAA